VQFARTLGTSTRSTNELERNLLHPQNAQKVRTFRLLTTLTGVVKMLIWRQSVFQPDFAMAQRMWDEWDRRLDQQYGLPRLTPRKNAKRINDCLTFTIMNAVACVFMFKQTACHFDTYPNAGEGPIPFDVSQLWRCVQMLQPTPEIIHYAWTCSLEYHIGTSCMGFAALSSVCDLYGRRPGDLLRRPPAWSFTEMESLCKDLNDHKEKVGKGLGASGSTAAAATNEAVLAANMSAADVTGDVIRNMTRQMRMKKRPRQAKHMFDSGDGNLVPLFRGADSVVSKAFIIRMRDEFRFRRQARAAYRLKNLETTLQSRSNFDSNAHIDELLDPKLSSVDHMGDDHHNASQHVHLKEHGLPVFEPAVVTLHPPPRNLVGSIEHRELMRYHELRYLPVAPIFVNESDSEEEKRVAIAEQERNYLNDVNTGVRAYIDNEDIDDLIDEPNYEAVKVGFESKQAAVEKIDASNCPRCLVGVHDPTCIFCNQSSPADLISLATSSIWADSVEAACFYSVQHLCEFALNSGILTSKVNGVPGMRPLARGVSFKQNGQLAESTPHVGSSTSNAGGSPAYDLGWMCKQACKEGKSPWDRVARQMDNHSWTVKAFDLHHEGIRDLLYLISMRDNSRRVAVLPGISNLKSGFVDEHGNQPNDNSQLLRFTAKAPAPSFNISDSKWRPQSFPPRHPASLVQDCDFQRACDARLAASQLVGLEVLASPNIVRSPPIRQNFEMMEASTTALHDHVCLLVESSLNATLMPGLTNLQEAFSNGEVGPAGFSSRADKNDKDKSGKGDAAKPSEASSAEARRGSASPSAAVASATASACSVASLSEVRGNLGDLAEPPSKRPATTTGASVDDGRSVTDATDISEFIGDGDGIHTLAYSYDVIQISIALDMCETLYDSTKALRLASQQAATTKTLVEHHNNLAHISLRFPGYEAIGRQTISMPVQTKPIADVTVPQGLLESNKQVGRRYVSLVLGRHATATDVDSYIQRLSGSRNLDGVQGNIFDAATWLKHSVHSLRRRGLVHGVVNDEVGLEPAFAILRSMPTGLMERFVEARYVEDADFQHLKLKEVSLPGSYWTDKEDLLNGSNTASKPLRRTENLLETAVVPTKVPPPPKRSVDEPVGETDTSTPDTPWLTPEAPRTANGEPISEAWKQEVERMQKECHNPAATSDDDLEMDEDQEDPTGASGAMEE
jgi:hypothetical protein